MKSTRVFYLLTFLIGQYALIHGQDSSAMTTLTGATTGTTQPTAVVQTTSEQVTNGQASTEPSTAAPVTATATSAATEISTMTTTMVPATTTTTRPATTTTTSAGAPSNMTEPITTEPTVLANTTTKLMIRTVRPTPSNPTWKIVGGLAGGLAGIGLIGMVGGIYICYKSSNGQGPVRRRNGSKIAISSNDF